MLEEIQALNTQATTLMEEGDHVGALERLSYITSKLFTCVLLPQSPLCGSSLVTIVNHSYRAESILARAAHTRSRPAVGQGDYWFVPFALEYADSVIARHRILDDPFMGKDEYTACSVTTLFNLGLCYHQIWNTNKRASSRYLLQALVHYRQAFAFLPDLLQSRRSPYEFNVYFPKSLLPVFMAICANASHCCQELGDIQQLQWWSQWLNSLVKSGDNQWIINCPHDYKFFAITAFHNGFGYHTAQAA